MHLERLFLYNDWANREEVSRLTALPDVPDAVRRLLAHIVGTEWLWLSRIGAAATKMDVWPDLTLDQCAQALDPLRDAWEATLRDADRDAVAEYRNSKGEAWKSTIGDIYTHVILHGAYHRGQIATLLRQSGAEPPYTDFIHAARNGLLDE